MSKQITKLLTKIKPKDHKYKKVMGFDIETHSDTNEFVLACFYSNDIQFTAHSKQEVIDFIQRKELRNYHIYATNLAFDFLGTFYEHSHKWSVSERQGTIYSFKWYQETTGDKLTKPVHFYDTLRILPFGVEKLGKILKIPKLPHPQCFGKIPQNNAQQTELITYCMQDAKISFLAVQELILPFLHKYNIPYKSTIGSMALYDFRRNHLEYALFQEPERNRDIAFKSYYGGRTETYKRGTFDNVFCFDINSLYPSAMCNPMPNPNRYFHRDKGTIYNINQYEGVSEIEVYIPETLKIPPLPFKHDQKLLFPVGKIRGYYTHIEIRNALKYGCVITDISEQLCYPQKTDFFSSFIKQHYTERLKYQAENNPLELMEKLTMNNLYGKFAFNYKQTSQLIPAHDFDFDKHVKSATFLQPIAKGEFVSITQQGTEAPIYSFPILSSYITAYARIQMYEYLANPQLQEKLISTDTDSIFLHDYNGEIQTSTKLGAMKLEDGYPIAQGIFVRPKMYYTHKAKCKGVKFSKDDKSEFLNILNLKPISQQRFTKYRTAVRSKAHHKNGLLTPNQILHITKELGLEDTKRNWERVFDYQTQETSTPLHLNTDDILDNLKTKHAQKSEITSYAGEDTFDHKGKDISKTEFLKNEIFFDTL